MRTNDMIYQAAIAHQTELRRIASARTSRADRGAGAAAENRLLSLIGAQRRRARATLRPATSGVAFRRAQA